MLRRRVRRLRPLVRPGYPVYLGRPNGRRDEREPAAPAVQLAALEVEPRHESRVLADPERRYPVVPPAGGRADPRVNRGHGVAELAEQAPGRLGAAVARVNVENVEHVTHDGTERHARP